MWMPLLTSTPAPPPFTVSVAGPASVYEDELSSTSVPTVVGTSIVTVRGELIALVKYAPAVAELGTGPNQLDCDDQFAFASGFHVGRAVSRYPCDCPAEFVPTPTTCQLSLIASALLSVHPVPAGIRL